MGCKSALGMHIVCAREKVQDAFVSFSPTVVGSFKSYLYIRLVTIGLLWNEQEMLNESRTLPLVERDGFVISSLRKSAT